MTSLAKKDQRQLQVKSTLLLGVSVVTGENTKDSSLQNTAVTRSGCHHKRWHGNSGNGLCGTLNFAVEEPGDMCQQELNLQTKKAPTPSQGALLLRGFPKRSCVVALLVERFLVVESGPKTRFSSLVSFLPCLVSACLCLPPAASLPPTSFVNCLAPPLKESVHQSHRVTSISGFHVCTKKV